MRWVIIAQKLAAQRPATAALVVDALASRALAPLSEHLGTHPLLFDGATFIDARAPKFMHDRAGHGAALFEWQLARHLRAGRGGMLGALAANSGRACGIGRHDWLWRWQRGRRSSGSGRDICRGSHDRGRRWRRWLRLASAGCQRECESEQRARRYHGGHPGSVVTSTSSIQAVSVVALLPQVPDWLLLSAMVKAVVRPASAGSRQWTNLE